MLTNRRTFVPLLVVALVVLAAVGLWRWKFSGHPEVKAPAAVADYVGSGPRVAVIGDSISFVSADAIDGVLGPRYSVSITAVPGIKFGAQQVTAKRYVATQPTVVVIALGTNDALQGGSVDAFKDQVHDMAARFPQSCVVVTTLTTTTGDPAFSQRATAYDQYLRTLPHVADWDAAVIQAQQAGRTVMADKVHPDADGQQLLAQVIGQAVSSCSGPATAS